MNKYSISANLLKDHYEGPIQINFSPSLGYRSRCEFGYQNKSYTMHALNGKKIYLNTFEVARPCISNLMPKFLDAINKNELINLKLFQINFRANSKNEVMTTLVYHKKLTEELQLASDTLAAEFNIQLIIRARKEFYSNKDGLLEDQLDRTNITLYQTDQSFYQPNYFMMPRMVSKVIDMIENPKDLLELYCGSGTFTLPLSTYFKNIFATENNRQSIRCLEKGIAVNKITNVNYSRLSDDEVTELLKGRVFRRMSGLNINNFSFSHILVDPPRSGLTQNVINILNKFDKVIYVSCNMETYLRDIKLLNSFSISDIEIFDQFPNTNHLEIVSLLSR
jgi:tRNA (uracil-5-)-methyltransferase